MKKKLKLLFGLLAIVLALVFLGALLADKLMPKSLGAPSHALALAENATDLDRQVVPVLRNHPGQSGVILLNDGLDAFAARALSARAAGRSLDLQYYMWHDDLSGQLLALEAWRAAERGVRVRILVDDMNANGLDPQMKALDQHPNVEIRIYNAFRNRSGIRRVFETLVRALRVNHRMHNKAWIADGRVAVVGGRNIGDEYFDTSFETNFRDLDAFLVGPAVGDAEKVFDRFWNDDAVVPMASLNKKEIAATEATMTAMTALARGTAANKYLSRTNSSPGVTGFLSGVRTPIWSANVQVVSDPPQKWKEDKRDQWLVRRLVDTVRSTQHSAALISPYFVPGDAGTSQLATLASEGKDIGVVTNSLAANDVPAVHSGYADYRTRLLQGGVKLFELRARGRTETAGLFGSSGASLHTKAFVIDGRRGFIGSFNLDMRSAALNTEMGVMFDDPQIGAALALEYQRLSSPALSYSVRLRPQGGLEWIDASTQPKTLLYQEPDTTALQRGTVKVLSWLPIESQL